MSFWFYSIQVIPLADVNAILDLGPVWATIGAALFLGERLRLRRIMAILVSFAGAMIIIKPGFNDIVPGTWAVMVTAAFFAFSDLIAKQLKAHHDDNLIIMALSITIAMVSLPLAVAVWQPVSPMNWLGVLIIGLAATLGHMSLMRSFAGPMWAAQAGKYIQLLFVILFGITLFDEIPTLSTLAGAMVVLAAVSYIAMREGRNQNAVQATDSPRSNRKSASDDRFEAMQATPVYFWLICFVGDGGVDLEIGLRRAGSLGTPILLFVLPPKHAGRAAAAVPDHGHLGGLSVAKWMNRGSP